MIGYSEQLYIALLLDEAQYTASRKAELGVILLKHPCCVLWISSRPFEPAVPRWLACWQRCSTQLVTFCCRAQRVWEAFRAVAHFPSRTHHVEQSGKERASDVGSQMKANETSALGAQTAQTQRGQDPASPRKLLKRTGCMAEDERRRAVAAEPGRLGGRRGLRKGSAAIC